VAGTAVGAVTQAPGSEPERQFAAPGLDREVGRGVLEAPVDHAGPGLRPEVRGLWREPEPGAGVAFDGPSGDGAHEQRGVGLVGRDGLEGCCGVVDVARLEPRKPLKRVGDRDGVGRVGWLGLGPLDHWLRLRPRHQAPRRVLGDEPWPLSLVESSSQLRALEGDPHELEGARECRVEGRHAVGMHNRSMDRSDRGCSAAQRLQERHDRVEVSP
jgi:hypothetical protein